MSKRHVFDFTFRIAMTQKEYIKFSAACFKAEEGGKVNPEWKLGKALTDKLHKMGFGGKLEGWTWGRGYDDIERNGEWTWLRD